MELPGASPQDLCKAHTQPRSRAIGALPSGSYGNGAWQSPTSRTQKC